MCPAGRNNQFEVTTGWLAIVADGVWRTVWNQDAVLLRYDSGTVFPTKIFGGINMTGKSKKTLSTLLAAALVISLFAAMPLTANAENATALKSTIEGFTHGGNGNLTATVSGATVTVVGSVNNAANIFALDIDAGVTVIWKAIYFGVQTNQLFSLTGAGTFEIAGGGIIGNTGTGYAVSSTDDGFTVKVSGGRVESAGHAIYIAGNNSTVTVSSGLVSSTGGAPIYIIGANGEVTVSGGTATCLNSNSFAIFVHSSSANTSVNVSGGFLLKYDSDNKGVISMENGKTPTIGGSAVVCAWIKPSGTPTYDEDASTSLTVLPSGASATWGYSGSATGIHYKNGTNTGFFMIDDVTVNETVPGTAGPFQVTEHPEGETYNLNDVATPIRATFEYGTIPGIVGSIDSMAPITVRWYWSNENSNTGRINGFAESTVDYSRQIKYTTPHVPATDTVGVRYYYAVLSYMESVSTGQGQWQSVPKEAVSNPARIEVIAPGASPTPTPTPGSGHSFTVKKEDENGAPLAGAVISLVPDDSHANQNSSVKSSDATSAANGNVSFSAVADGYYILGEKQAPSGYNASNEKYYIQITPNGVFIYDPTTSESNEYETVTFVNKEIPQLDKVNHYAFMQGYPEGDFRPESNMTRAEAVVMFSRLLSKSMDLNTDYRKSYYPDVDYANPSINEPWYANQVCYMHMRGVLADYSRDERFRPDDPVTRAEFATLASHFDNLMLTDTNIFPDVPTDHWAVKYINSSAAKGWITGYPDGTFGPENNITRAEVVTLVGRMLERSADSAYLEANKGSLPREYWDFSTDHWAYLMIMEASTGHDYTKDASGEHWTSAY